MGFMDNISSLMTLQEKGAQAKSAFDDLRGAIDSTDFNSGRFDNIITALQKLLDILKSVQAIHGVPTEVKAATDSGVKDVTTFQQDVENGQLGSADDMHERLDELIAKYKSQLGPLASALE